MSRKEWLLFVASVITYFLGRHFLFPTETVLAVFLYSILCSVCFLMVGGGIIAFGLDILNRSFRSGSYGAGPVMLLAWLLFTLAFAIGGPISALQTDPVTAGFAVQYGIFITTCIFYLFAFFLVL